MAGEKLNKKSQAYENLEKYISEKMTGVQFKRKGNTGTVDFGDVAQSATAMFHEALPV